MASFRSLGSLASGAGGGIPRLARLVAAALLGLVAPVVHAYDTQQPSGGEALTPAQQARYDGLIHELRCLVCQNETIADSNADLAADLRNQVRAHIASGQTDDEVRRYLTDRYGEFVLYRPPFSARSLLLWTGPFLMVAIAALVAVRRLRRAPVVAATGASATGSPATGAPDAARLRRLLDEERG